MNNVAKFEETRKAVENFKKGTEYLIEEGEKALEKKGPYSATYQKAFLNLLQTMKLTIDCKKEIVKFETSHIGTYVQPIYIKRRRVNVVPLCFLIQLYIESIAGISEAKTYEIPFTLRGFWKMDKSTEECVAGLNKLITKSVLNLSRCINYKDVTAVQKKDINDLINLMRQMQVSPIKYGKYAYIDVFYQSEKFTFKLCNTKLDIVPFCKIVCKYYFAVMNKITEIEKNFKVNGANLHQVEEDYTAFVEKYFVPRMRVM